MRSALLFLAFTMASAQDASWLRDLQKWRADYETEVKSPTGWLSVAGLFWLHEGVNVVGSDPQADVVLPAGAPKRAGVLRLQHGAVSYEPVSGGRRVLKPDDPGPPDTIAIGDVSMTIVNRGNKVGARLRDPHAGARRNFTGCKWFPPDEKWRVKARWTAWSAPKKIAITNIIGMTEPEDSPGFAEFTLGGRKMRLDPITEDGRLFFLFKDQTSGKETYGAGRFLYAAMPKGGVVELDFNRAENPPCAFTPYATCPLPPRQNWLPVAIEAGEKKYGHH
ncbi:MAG TPA: DUF1684 domain-containing protein [Bryobacteraceae bacterium]|nr:DUF1684 domain-containing protein [Bryobacteraceae bacterium]